MAIAMGLCFEGGGESQQSNRQTDGLHGQQSTNRHEWAI